MTPRQTNRDRKFVRIMSVRILTTRRYQMEGGRNRSPRRPGQAAGVARCQRIRQRKCGDVGLFAAARGRAHRAGDSRAPIVRV